MSRLEEKLITFDPEELIKINKVELFHWKVELYLLTFFSKTVINRSEFPLPFRKLLKILKAMQITSVHKVKVKVLVSREAYDMFDSPCYFVWFPNLMIEIEKNLFNTYSFTAYSPRLQLFFTYCSAHFP